MNKTKENLIFNTLKEAVLNYVQNKKMSDVFSGKAKTDNELIKNCLAEIGEDEYTVDDVRVFLVRSKKQEMDEDALIQKLKDSGLAKGIVRRKEYIDLEALESALYYKRIKAEDISGCFSEKENISLRIGKAK